MQHGSVDFIENRLTTVSFNQFPIFPSQLTSHLGRSNRIPQGNPGAACNSVHDKAALLVVKQQGLVAEQGEIEATSAVTC